MSCKCGKCEKELLEALLPLGEAAISLAKYAKREIRIVAAGDVLALTDMQSVTVGIGTTVAVVSGTTSIEIVETQIAAYVSRMLIEEQKHMDRVEQLIKLFEKTEYFADHKVNDNNGN